MSDIDHYSNQTQSDFFSQFDEPKPSMMGIFARIPAPLYMRVAEICHAEKRSRYEVVKAALTMLVASYDEYRMNGASGKQNSFNKIK